MGPARLARWLLILALLGGGLLYHAKGIGLLFRADGGGDALLRWQEEHYVLRGRNPYDVTFAALGVGRPPADRSRVASPEADIGVPDSGGYPPWAFASGAAMFWPPWPAGKAYFLWISLLLTATTAAWAYRLTRPAGDGPDAGWLGAASVLGIGAYGTNCHVGQYGGVVVGLLALSAWALGSRREVLGGLLLGVSLLKPTISGPFALILLFGGRWRALAACVGYVAAASAAVWWRTATDPAEMLLQMLAAGSDFVDDSQGLVGVLRRAGLSSKQVTPALAAGVLAPGLLLLWANRRRPIFEQFAIASVVGRLWAYHKFYDNMMLAFLLAAAARLALRRRSPACWVGFLAAGTAVWAPASLFRGEAMVFAQIGCWALGLAILLAESGPPEPGPVSTPTPEGAP